MRDFHQARKALGVTVAAFSRLTGVHEETVRGWGKARSGRGVQDVPGWAWLLLDTLETFPAVLAWMRERS